MNHPVLCFNDVILLQDSDAFTGACESNEDCVTVHNSYYYYFYTNGSIDHGG